MSLYQSGLHCLTVAQASPKRQCATHRVGGSRLVNKPPAAKGSIPAVAHAAHVPVRTLNYLFAPANASGKLLVTSINTSSSITTVEKQTAAPGKGQDVLASTDYESATSSFCSTK